MNRMDADNYDDLFITRVAQRILAALPGLGWVVSVEDDYADLKNYLCSRETVIFEAFCHMDMVIKTTDLDPTDAEGVEVHFLFSADPARLPADRNAYGRALHKDNCRVLRTACEEILRAVGTPVSEPGVKIRYRPKGNMKSFDGGESVIVAYEVEISYWIAA